MYNLYIYILHTGAYTQCSCCYECIYFSAPRQKIDDKIVINFEKKKNTHIFLFLKVARNDG